MKYFKFRAGGHEFNIQSSSATKAKEILQAFIDKHNLNWYIEDEIYW